MRVCLRTITIVAIVLGTGEAARAQWQGAADAAQGMFGSRSLGSSVSAGNRSFGSSGRSSSGGGTMGGGNFGGNAGQIDSSSRFVRGNRDAGQFVGSDSREVRDFLGAVNSGMAGNRGGQSGFTSRRSGQSRNPNQSGRGSAGGPIEVRTALRVAFEYDRPVPDRVSKALADRLTNSSRIRVTTPLEVLIHQRTAILRGVVASERDRELAERVARLEPGISVVKNELTIAEPANPPPNDRPPDRPSRSNLPRPPATR